MHSEDGKLRIHKSLGGAERFIETFRARYENKECLIHLRMKTHGKIDLENCHPYEVLNAQEGGELGAVWMMHNGVLSTGYMSGDNRKSDTWHYIKNRLAPLLRRNPKFLMYPEMQQLLERDIGSNNKFALMCSRGDVFILNRSSGTQWKGAWFSNTYAWSASAEGGPTHTTGYQGTYQGNYRSSYNHGAWNPQASAFATRFFAMLREGPYKKAYQELQYHDMQQVYTFSRQDAEDFFDDVNADAYPSDDEIIAYVREVQEMIREDTNGKKSDEVNNASPPANASPAATETKSETPNAAATQLPLLPNTTSSLTTPGDV